MTWAIIGGIGLAIMLFGDKVLTAAGSMFNGDHTCLPADDAAKIEMLMEMRETDERFASDDARLSINYCIETLTGTLEEDE